MNWILEKVQEESNLEELLTKENDSQLLFQLSPMRKNLIEWIPFDPSHVALEIGAGCGIITGFLAERCAKVVAVESDEQYIEVNQYLNRDKDNIEYASSMRDWTNKDVQFDEVILIGLTEQSKKLGTNSKELLNQAIRLLRPEGRLILALDNKYALKYWAGMNFDSILGLSDNMTLIEAKNVLTESGLSEIRCFYPNADYRLPIEIFSEKHPIKEGTITANARDYENTRYQLFDEVMASDELCRDGMYEQFASSYLLVAQKSMQDTALDDVLYTKYNSIRASKFQLRTTIRKENGLRYVEKVPMCQEAEQHLQQMIDNRILLDKAYKNVKLVACEKLNSGLKFAFIKGKPILSVAEEKCSSLDALVEQIRAAFAIMFEVNSDICVPFYMTDAFAKMYPECTPKNGCPSYAVANLDSIVSNFVRTEEGEVYCLDYEWVADFPVPENYIKYRSLLYIYNENQAFVSSITDLDSLLKAFDITESEIALYDKMEIDFQQYVHGKNLKYNYLSRYEKPSINWDELVSGDATKRIEEVTKQLQDKDTHIHNIEIASAQKDELLEERKVMIAQRDADLKHSLDNLQSAQVQMQAQKDYIDRLSYLKKKPIQTIRDLINYKIQKKHAWKEISQIPNPAEKRAQFVKQMERRDFAYERMMQTFEAQETYNEVFEYQPLISVLVPVYNVADEYLIACIESVRNQIYPNWELCLADDCSTQDSVREVLNNYENDKRIKICYRTENGHISKCTNSALEMATGEFVGFLDCDDTLSANALYEVAKALNENKSLDFIYSDEDKVFADGTGRHNPHFKPDWSPDTLMSFMYTSHFSVYRTSITKELGGLRSECNGAQDYDFTLRFTEQIPAEHICHIPKVLYHWREIEGSTSESIEAKPYVIEAQRRAKQDALDRRGLKGNLTQQMNQIHVEYIPQNNPKVSIIIPSKDNYPILKRAIDSLVSITAYENYEVILVDNGSLDLCRKKYDVLMKEYQEKNPSKNFIYHYKKMEFNFSHMCNLGASLASGEIYLFLNDDIEILYPDWLEVMVGQAQVPHSGAVGAKLYYPDSKKIQHAGIIQIKNGPSHAFCGFEDKEFFYFGRNCMSFNYCAVTGACLAVEADKFHKVGGFEENLPVAYNDVDLCFKLYEAGYYNVLCTDAVLYHHESVSRGYDYLDEKKMERLARERGKLYERHPALAARDPFYHPYLVPNNVDFSYNSKDLYNNEVEAPKTVQMDFVSHLNVDSLRAEEDFMFEGWSWDEACADNNKTVRLVMLERMENGIVVETRVFDTFFQRRSDVADGCPGRFDLDYIGFCCRIKKELLQPGTYYVSLLSYEENGKMPKKHRVGWTIDV